MKSSIALSVCLLAGCSWADVILEESRAVPRDASFGYSQGYNAGCRTGISEVGGLGFDKPAPVRDEGRMKSEQDYRAGWDEGKRRCTDKYAGRVLRRHGLD